MSTVIKLKYSNLTAQPADDLLQISEPAYSFTSGGRLFLGADDGSGGTTPHAIGGKYFTDKLDHTPGTLTANSAIIVDANSKIDVLNIDNITIDGNSITSSDVNGNIILDPNGTGEVQIQGVMNVTSLSAFSANVSIVSDVTQTGNNAITGTLSVTGNAGIDNIGIDGNTISSTDTDGDIILDPNGTGTIVFDGPVSYSGGSTATFTDLTATRVVFVGASSELVDSAGLTFISGTGVLGVTGAIQVDNLNLDGNTLSATNSNGSVVLTANGTGTIDLSNNNTALKIPAGVDGTRPTAASVGNGSIRYNETTGRFEGTVSGAWTGLGGVIDVDQDTYITAEEGADDDTIRVYAANSEVMTANTTVVRTTVETRVPKLVVDYTGTSNNSITLDNNVVTINGSTIEGTGDSTSGTVVIDPAPAAGDNGGDLIVRGNLQVTGTTTTIESTVVTIEDPVMELGNTSVVDVLDRGIIANWYDGSAANTAFIGWDRGVDNNFTFIIGGSTADAKFANLKLTGSIVSVDGVAPTAGQLLIGNTTNGDMELATLTQGDSLTITNSDGGIEIDVDAAATQATIDPFSELVTAGSFETGVEYTIVSVNDGLGGATTDYTAIGSADNNIGTTFTATGVGAGTGQARSTGNNYASDGDNAPNRGAASFASEQFTVTSGHVVLTEIDGGTF